VGGPLASVLGQFTSTGGPTPAPNSNAILEAFARAGSIDVDVNEDELMPPSLRSTSSQVRRHMHAERGCSLVAAMCVRDGSEAHQPHGSPARNSLFGGLC
jgi:hypothetical protein